MPLVRGVSQPVWDDCTGTSEFCFSEEAETCCRKVPTSNFCPYGTKPDYKIDRCVCDEDKPSLGCTNP